VDLQDVLHRAARMLAQITDSAAVVQMPNLRVSTVKHCEVVALSPVRLLVVVITDNGRVEQRNVELDSVMEAEDVLRLRDVLNNALAGKTLAEATAHLDILEEQVALDIRPHLRKAANVLVDTLVEYPAERYLLAGTPNLTRNSITSRGIDLSGILEALEEQVVVLNLLTRVPEVGNISVVIGEEHDDDQLRQASVVTTAYGTDGEVLGGLGVVGPTFMDYSGTMSRVSAVAHYVSDILGHE
ncbi:HrcA family transcriptional regulator, partial [Corynebacterium stationis]